MESLLHCKEFETFLLLANQGTILKFFKDLKILTATDYIWRTVLAHVNHLLSSMTPIKEGLNV